MTKRIFHIATAGFEAARQLPGQAMHGHSFSLSALADHEVQGEVQAAAERLNYQCINEHSPVASDVGIALALAEQLPAACELRLRSAPNQGVVLQGTRALTWRSSRFEAAHHLPHVPPGHKCGRLHGHGFQVTLFAEAAVSQAQLARHWQPLHKRLHGHYLNRIPGLENPTSEVLAQWLWQQLQENLPELALVVVQETATAGCSFDGSTHRIWKQQDAECALYLPSQSEPLGHSYNVRLHLQAPLDEVMGWTLDYGDVKALFKPAYERLDHHCINDLPGVAEPLSEHLALWLCSELQALLPQLYRIDLMHTPEQGVLLEWPLAGEADKAAKSAAVPASSIASSPRLMI